MDPRGTHVLRWDNSEPLSRSQRNKERGAQTASDTGRGSCIRGAPGHRVPRSSASGCYQWWQSRTGGVGPRAPGGEASIALSPQPASPWPAPREGRRRWGGCRSRGKSRDLRWCAAEVSGEAEASAGRRMHSHLTAPSAWDPGLPALGLVFPPEAYLFLLSLQMNP